MQPYIACATSALSKVRLFAVRAAMAGNLALFILGNATAATVNWLDPLGYRKPVALDVTMPDEASATKYWVNFSGGADTASCGISSGSPCATMRGLADRSLSGLRGNIADSAAYVYVRGTGKFFIYNNTFAGTPGKEIVIK